MMRKAPKQRKIKKAVTVEVPSILEADFDEKYLVAALPEGRRLWIIPCKNCHVEEDASYNFSILGSDYFGATPRQLALATDLMSAKNFLRHKAGVPLRKWKNCPAIVLAMTGAVA